LPVDPPWLTRRCARRLLLALLLPYIAVGLFFIRLFPLGEGPDEMHHFNFVVHLVKHHALPVMHPCYADNFTPQGIQSPLYYLLGAILTRQTVLGEPLLDLNPRFTFGGDQPAFFPRPEHSTWQAPWSGWRLLRLLSLMLGAAGIAFGYRLLRAAREPRWVALAAAALLALNPQFIFMHSMVTNDALTVLASSAALWCCLRVLAAPAACARWAWLGLACAAALLTKLNLLGLALPVMLLIFFAWRNPSVSRARPLGNVSVMLALLALTGGWWFWRNWQLYGDPLATRIEQLALAPVFYPAPLSLSQWLARGPSIAKELFREMWGCYGWVIFHLPRAAYVALALCCALAVAGWLRHLWGLRRNGRPIPGWCPARSLLLAAYAGVLGLLALRNFVTFAAQYRYLWGVHIVMAWLLVRGWAAWAPHRPWRILWPITAGGLLLIAYSIIAVIWPIYHALPSK
jgi:hypothetical protein